MGYCAPRWIGDYHFTNALRFRLREAEPYSGTPARSLLLWGGVGADGVPFLEPAFVVETQPTLPRSGGEYRLTGRTGGGAELFSLSFSMPEVADGNGSSSFAFTLPVHPGWERSLAAIALSGPGGSATLDGGSDTPVVILRDPANGQVRAILRDLPELDAAEEGVSAALGGPDRVWRSSSAAGSRTPRRGGAERTTASRPPANSLSSNGSHRSPGFRDRFSDRFGPKSVTQLRPVPSPLPGTALHLRG